MTLEQTNLEIELTLKYLKKYLSNTVRIKTNS